MQGLRNQRKNQTREDIFLTSLELFRQLGFENVSVREIVESVGIAKGTFFNYYPSKVDLLAEWYEQLVRNSIRQPNIEGDISDVILKVAEDTVRLALKDKNLWLAKTQYAQTNPNIQRVEKESDLAFRLHLNKLISDGMTWLDSQASFQLSDLVVTLITGSIREWVVTGMQADINKQLSKRITFLVKLAKRN